MKTKIIFHVDIWESGKWHQMSFLQQYANLGTEICRTIKAKESNDTPRFEEAAQRMFELFYMTVDACTRKKTPGKLKETLRAKEVTLDFLYGDNLYSSSPKNFESYFFTISVLANEERRLSQKAV